MQLHRLSMQWLSACKGCLHAKAVCMQWLCACNGCVHAMAVCMQWLCACNGRGPRGSPLGIQPTGEDNHESERFGGGFCGGEEIEEMEGRCVYDTVDERWVDLGRDGRGEQGAGRGGWGEQGGEKGWDGMDLD